MFTKKNKFLLVLMCLYSTVNAQEFSTEQCLKDLKLAADNANEVSAKILSPQTYKKALAAQGKANSTSKKAKYICEQAKKSSLYFRSATENAKLASQILKNLILNRRNAIKVNGPNKYLSKWQKAEQKFVLANKSIENGNLERAKKLNIEATKDFNEIELLCIKDELLSEAKLKISLAKKEKADRYAQITLAQAQKFLDMADQELTIDRYNFDVVTNITNRSIERSAHAIFLSQLIQSTQDDLITTEELIIQWETDLEKIANSADIYPLMTDGYNSLTNSLVKYIDILRNEKQYLEQDQKDNLIQIADMKEEIRNLDERLGGATQERETLIQKIEAQARVKEQFDKVEKMFNSAEARVFRENNNVILRLIGLTFESNESKIIKESIPLLVKVEKAIDVYPRSEIIIEGHTDSQGDDQLNQKLSQLRADSIKQYMINAMRVKSYRIIATGFGETRPVANNETALGREKNRRIDIVLHSSQSNEIN
jgi:OmpA-OmpF porin, OOP family